DAETMIAVTVGSRLDLVSLRAAQDGVRTWHEIRTRFPESPIYLSVVGYDDDRREIADIPEAARFFRRWARIAGIRSPEQALAQNLCEISAAMLAACGAFGPKMQEEARRFMPKSKPLSS